MAVRAPWDEAKALQWPSADDAIRSSCAGRTKRIRLREGSFGLPRSSNFALVPFGKVSKCRFDRQPNSVWHVTGKAHHRRGG